MKFSRNESTPKYINVDLSDEEIFMVKGDDLTELKKNILEALDKRIDNVFYENNLIAEETENTITD